MKKVIYVVTYREVPPQAQYVLRNLEGKHWALERYYDADCKVLRYFRISTLPGEEEKEFNEALEMCKRLIPDSAILYAEKPVFMLTEDDVDKLLF